MKEGSPPDRKLPATFFISRRFIVGIAIITGVMLVLLGLQEFVLKRSGYRDGLYDGTPSMISICGMVIDADTGTGVRGVKVSREGKNDATLTGADGRFALELQAGTQPLKLVIEKEGYISASIKITGGELIIPLQSEKTEPVGDMAPGTQEGTGTE